MVQRPDGASFATFRLGGVLKESDGVMSAADLSPVIDVPVAFAPIKNEPVHVELAVR